MLAMAATPPRLVANKHSSTFISLRWRVSKESLNYILNRRGTDIYLKHLVRGRAVELWTIRGETDGEGGGRGQVKAMQPRMRRWEGLEK